MARQSAEGCGPEQALGLQSSSSRLPGPAVGSIEHRPRPLLLYHEDDEKLMTSETFFLKDSYTSKGLLRPKLGNYSQPLCVLGSTPVDSTRWIKNVQGKTVLPVLNTYRLFFSLLFLNNTVWQSLHSTYVALGITSDLEII